MTIIKKENEKDIANIHIHDLQFNNFCYNHDSQIVQLNLSNITYSSKILMHFKQVLFVSMTCVEFWSPGSNVFSCNIFDTQVIVGKLKEKAESETKNWREISKFSESQKENIGFEITINSGDVIKIICKEINIDATMTN